MPEPSSQPAIDRDVTPPPAPSVVSARCFSRVLGRARDSDKPGSVLLSRRYAPVYIELADVELGTRLQIINLSARPDAVFDDGDVHVLRVTGREPRTRRAAIYIDQDQARRYDIKPGDQLRLRAVDRSGNVSPSVGLKIEGERWASRQIRERQDLGWMDCRGASYSALDGEAQRKEVLMAAVKDGRVPVLLVEHVILQALDDCDDEDRRIASVLVEHWSALAEHLGGQGLRKTDLSRLVELDAVAQALREVLAILAAQPERFDRLDQGWQQQDPTLSGMVSRLDLEDICSREPAVRMQAEGAAEPQATLEVLNQRSGRVCLVTVDGEGKIDFRVGGVRDGDPLLITPVDDSGQVGRSVELVFDRGAPGGKAARVATEKPLPGVL